MTLVLHSIALNEAPMSQPLVGRFDERGGTIGRSDNATFTLPDPERMISRAQAQVLHRDDGYWIENVSAASPILHNGRPLSAGMRVQLRDGDELRIGGYTLQAAFEHDETSATILRGRTVITHQGKLEGSPTPQRAATPTESPTPSLPGAEALWRGFLDGAGIDSALRPTPELLTHIGTMMRIIVGGIHRLVAMRAMTKDEMQAQMTVIKAHGNNPLKFAPDTTMALQLLLQPPARGLLSGPAALRDALIDLESHQVGVMAGMRAAVEAVLNRFDPEQLEALLAKGSVFDSLRPAHRRARLWDVYVEHYRALRGEAQEDFQRFFDEAFRQAYEAQVRSLEAAHESASAAGPSVGGGSR